MRKRTMSRANASSKRARTAARPVGRVYGVKPEMKNTSLAFNYAATQNLNIDLTAIANGSINGERVGAKVKFWNVEVVMQSSDPLRADILIPQITNTLPSYNSNSLGAPQDYVVLHKEFFAPSDATNTQPHYFNYRFPMGVVSKWDGSAAADITKNQLILRLMSPAATDFTGIVRCWYTDA